MSGTKVGDFVIIRGGGTPSTARDEFWNGEIPWVSPKDMKFDDVYDAEDKISEAAIDNSATNLIPVGACLVVVRSGILARTVPIGLTQRPVAINQDIKALCPSDDLHPKYLFYTLKRYEALLLSRVTRGATVHRLATEDLRSLPLNLPSFEQQIKICDRLDQIMQEMASVRDLIDQKLRKMGTLRQSILAASIGGE